MKYYNFNIFFGAQGDNKFKIRVESMSGAGTAIIDLTQDVEQLLLMGTSLARQVRSGNGAVESAPLPNRDAEYDAPPPLAPLELGKQLYRDLFVGVAGSQLNQALGNVQGRDSGLRIRLHIDPNDADVARLASLPWELLCHPFMGDQPLALSASTPLVRQLDSPLPSHTRAFEPPLRVLVVVSDPEGVAHLDLAQERQNIERSWGGRPGVHVQFLENATLKELTRELGRNDYHVFHFMGHGDFDAAAGVGCLLMETADNKKDPVDGRTLGLALKDAKSMRLVFLNACNTAKLNREPGKDAYAGVATALVMVGIPAVVAMQFPISDQAAIEFADSLYSNLVQGASIEGAVTEGRRAIRFANRSSLEWATPVLFMSAANGRLFEVEGGHQPVATVQGPEPESEPAIEETNARPDSNGPVEERDRSVPSSPPPLAPPKKTRRKTFNAVLSAAAVLAVAIAWLTFRDSGPRELPDPLSGRIDPPQTESAGPTAETQPPALPQPELLAHYTLDGPKGDKNKVADETGRHDARFSLIGSSGSRAGKPVNSSVFEFGPVGMAAKFTTEGSARGFMVSDHIPFGADSRAFTISAWIKINQMNPARLLGQDDWVNLGLFRSGELRFGEYKGNEWARNRYVSSGANAIQAGEWVFVAVTYQRPELTLRIFRQGKLAKSDSMNIAISNPGICNFVVGGRGEKSCWVGQYDDQDNDHPASFDDIRIYDAALDQSQLTALASEGRL